MIILAKTHRNVSVYKPMYNHGKIRKNLKRYFYMTSYFEKWGNFDKALLQSQTWYKQPTIVEPVAPNPVVEPTPKPVKAQELYDRLRNGDTTQWTAVMNQIQREYQ